MQVTRIVMLLSHLRQGRWRQLPKNIGLKTAVEAREMGWVELDIANQRDPRARLTPDGKECLLEVEMARFFPGH